MLNKLIKELENYSEPRKKESYTRFFSSEYTDKNDIFIGVKVPEIRKVVENYKELSLSEIQKLLNSKIHEHRMAAGFLLRYKFQKNPEIIFNFYVKNAKNFYNWDLVDTTADKIMGKFLVNNSRRILYDLAKSKNLWEKRISIVANLELIRNNDFKDSLKIFKIHLADSHHLTHKAVGWMLREIGKRNSKILLNFLKINYEIIPRITLRYAIEKFSKNERKQFLKGNFNKSH